MLNPPWKWQKSTCTIWPQAATHGMTFGAPMSDFKSYVVDGKAATLAINAGNDLIITSDFVNMYNEVLTAVNNGEISLERINDSVKRILAWKIAYNM